MLITHWDLLPSKVEWAAIFLSVWGMWRVQRQELQLAAEELSGAGGDVAPVLKKLSVQ